ncbi:MAG: IS1 family transposase [Hormoscilla sp. GM7CHS1pb]|nr:IS1 family transposase [Hormoscilla sp. GM7CHS1pb]
MSTSLDLCWRPDCPECSRARIVKNGSTHNKKQKYKCKDCGRQFVENQTKKNIYSEKKKLIDILLLERIALAGIARIVKVSQTWLQDYVNKKYAETPLKVSDKPKGKLSIECDEMWSFVGKKGNKQWIWLALDTKTREIVGLYVGDRSSGKIIMEILTSCLSTMCSRLYRFLGSLLIPQKRHKPVGKESGKTNHIERLNNTLRQRISRLVSQTLSFSKKLENHIGAIWYFVHHYNKCLSG